MKISIPYGKTQLTAETPENAETFIPDTSQNRANEKPEQLVSESLNHPLDSPQLQEVAKAHQSATIIVNDATRACPDEVIASSIINSLEAAGMSSVDISIAIASGLHEPAGMSEKKEILGNSLVQRYEVFAHDAENSPCTSLGTTSQGIPISVNSKALENDLLIATGIVEPHFFAGFSGGRKSILPGIASKQSILDFHSYEMIADKNTRAGIVQENPTHQAANEAAQMAGLDFIVNVVVDIEGNPVYAVSGDPYSAFADGVQKCRDKVTVESPWLADIVITSNSGYPLDQNLYQTVKGMSAASQIVKENGTIIVVSECSRGLGPETFYDLQKTSSSPEDLLHRLETGNTIVAQWENQVLSQILAKIEVVVISEIEDHQIQDMMMTPCSSLQRALELAVDHQGEDSRIAVLPEGPALLPTVKAV